jgi:hypothetical protein
MIEIWTSHDVERDPAGFLKAQQKERERAEAEAKKQQEADDLKRFLRVFVAEGGEPVTQRPSGDAPAASRPPRARARRRKPRAARCTRAGSGRSSACCIRAGVPATNPPAQVGGEARRSTLGVCWLDATLPPPSPAGDPLRARQLRGIARPSPWPLPPTPTTRRPSQGVRVLPLRSDTHCPVLRLVLLRLDGPEFSGEW